MNRTIEDRLQENTERGFVGRNAELAWLDGVLTGSADSTHPGTLVAVVHGPGGIGKSRLLGEAVRRLPCALGATLLDGREIEPTPRGVCVALARALCPSESIPGVAPDSEDAAPDRLVARIAEALAVAPRHVVVLDAYEALGLVDSWLRADLLPALPSSVLMVLAGRERPAPAWHTTPGWAGGTVELRLGPLSVEESHDLLSARGMDAAAAARANDYARGHPLALELAAAAANRVGTPAVDSPVTAGGPVPEDLLATFVSTLTPEVVVALEAASTTRRVTEPLLAAVLDETPAGGVRRAYEALRRLPFVDTARDGLVLHDVVRDTIGHELAVRDPERRRRHRRRAARFLDRRQTGRDENLWARTADLMFLIDNPVVRDACFPSARPSHVVEPARPEDGDDIVEIIRRHEPAPAADVLARWWAVHPETFAVARDAGGAVAAFVQIAELGSVSTDLIDADPVARSWRAHLDADPPTPGERVLLMRRWLGRESGELRSDPVSACWLDVKRTYMQWRPDLRRLYSVVVDLASLGPIFLPLGFSPVGPAVDGPETGATPYRPVWLDFGPGSVDGWLAGLVDAETDPLPEPAQRADEPRHGLSEREREVLVLIADGLSNRDIGGRLVISEKTAGRHVSNIFTKLDVHTRAQAARYAAENGLLPG